MEDIYYTLEQTKYIYTRILKIEEEKHQLIYQNEINKLNAISEKSKNMNVKLKQNMGELKLLVKIHSKFLKTESKISALIPFMKEPIKSKIEKLTKEVSILDEECKKALKETMRLASHKAYNKGF